MKSVLATILSIYVLAGSIGTPFVMHTCFSMDKTEYGIRLEGHCCDDGEGKALNTFIKNDCCEFISTYLQVDFEGYANLVFFTFASPVQVLEFSFDAVEDFSSSQVKNLIEHTPPSKYGRSLLSFVQSFLI